MSAINDVVSELSKSGEWDAAQGRAIDNSYGEDGIPKQPSSEATEKYYAELRKEAAATIRKRLSSETLSPFLKQLIEAAIPLLAQEIAQREGNATLKAGRGIVP